MRRVSLCLTVLAALAACAPPDPPNVLLVSIDTLRADHLSSYGYQRPTSPFLDRLAEDGVLFERASSTSSWTVPSMVSLVSGLHPEYHGVVNGQGTQFGPVLQEVIPEEAVLLAERLRDAGYRTFAITTNEHLSEDFGFAQGFDRYRSLGTADAEAVQEVLTEWLAELKAAERYFLWLHYFDPHSPYHARAPWIDEFADDAGAMARRVPEVDWPGQYLQMGIAPGTPRHHYVEALYDSEIRYLDGALEQVFTQLEVDREDLVAIVADHGEEFLEHGKFGHSDGLYEELVHVPLILRLPSGEFAGRRVATPVSILDVYPTILTAAGVPLEGAHHGLALQDVIEGEPRPIPVLPSVVRHRETHSITEDGWKLIHDPEKPTEDRLFHLASDPAEQQDRKKDEEERVKVLRQHIGETLEAIRDGRLTPDRKPLNDQQIEALRALGYIK